MRLPFLTLLRRSPGDHPDRIRRASGRPRAWSELWATLKSDPYAGCFLGTLLLLSLPYFLPILTYDQLWSFADLYANLFLLPAIMLALQGRLATIAHPGERRFWHYLTLAFFFWWLVGCLYAFVPDRWWGTTADLLTDGGFALFYLSILLGLETRPHLKKRDSVDFIRTLESSGVIVVVFGLLFYFVLIPNSLDPAAYETWLPSLYLYVALDLILTARFAWLFQAATTLRWRALYGLLGLMSLLFTVLDLGECLSYAEVLELPPVSKWDLLWNLPLVTLVLAARLRHHGFPENTERVVEKAPTPRIGSPLVLSAFLFPILHFGLGTFGLLTVATRTAREGLVCLALVVLGAMAAVEHVLLRRKATFSELQRRIAEKETEERTAYLNYLIENSPLAIVVLDSEHRVKICNPAFEALFLYPPSEIIGTTLDDFISAEETVSETRELTQQVLQGRPVHEVTRRRRRDGSVVDVEVHGVPLMVEGKLVGVFGLYQDITERRLAEQAQQEIDERFRRLAAATFEGIVIHDQGGIIDANEQYARMLDMTSQEIIGRRIEELVAPEDRAMVGERIRSGDERAYEYQMLRSDGAALSVEVHSREIPYRGRTVGVTAVRDVTDHRRLEEGIRQAQKMEAIGRLAGGIAHDFNNLLTVISGYSHLLALQLESDPLRGQVEEIHQAAERATLLTQQLLAFGRQQALQTEILELNKVVGGMEKMLRRLVREDIGFEFRLGPLLGKIEGDRGQIEQVILNLAINAGDAMPEGGTLTIETANVKLDETAAHRIPNGSPGSYVLLTVSDTGTGMDSKTLSQVFEPFFTTKKKGKGTGLGLATVYGVVKQSGGSIDVDSALDRGTTFRVYLPRVGDSVETTERKSAARKLPRGSETVLVVEDEPGVRRLAVEFLELHGYQVIDAETGVEALEKVGEYAGKMDLILTDVVMPGMSGPEMVERLVRLRPKVKVVYMSGYAEEVLNREGSPAVTHLLQKPFSVEELTCKVREVLGGTETGRMGGKPGQKQGQGVQVAADGGIPSHHHRADEPHKP